MLGTCEAVGDIDAATGPAFSAFLRGAMRSSLDHLTLFLINAGAWMFVTSKCPSEGIIESPFSPSHLH